jgi:hypothetical protein
LSPFFLDLPPEKVYNNDSFQTVLPKRMWKMMKGGRLFVPVLMVSLFGFSGYATAGATATQVVKISVAPFAVISLGGDGGKNWTRLVVDGTGITTGSQELKWSTNLKGTRITIQSSLAADEQDYILRARAINLNSRGKSKGWVNVNKEPSDIISDIAQEIGSCSLEYEALPRTGGKSGRDEHVLIYTITE